MADETRDRKRLRVSRACDECRRRKDRCDGRQPICRPCSNGMRTCTYNLFTKKRGLPTGYIRAIETLLGLIFRHVDGSEASVLALLTAEEGTSGSRGLSTTPGQTSSKVESLVEVWRKSSVAKQIELLLPLAETLGDDDVFARRLDEKFTLALSHVATRNITGRDSLNSFSGHTHSQEGKGNPDLEPLNRATELPPGHTHLPSTDGGPFHLPENWPQLLDLYFANTHSWFPISQKQDLLRPAYNLANNNPDQTQQLATDERAFLWAVFSYTSYQYESLNQEPKAASYFEPLKYSSCELSSATKSFISSSQRHGIGFARAFLLLGLLEIGKGCWSEAWILVGQAVYIAIDLEIFPPTLLNPDTLLRSTEEGQNRVSRGCFVLDTIISAYLGRRPYLKKSDLGPIWTLQTDGIEEWEAWQPNDVLGGDTQIHQTPRRQTPGRVLSTFNKFLDLIIILNELISKSDTDSLDSISEVPQRLDLWKQELSSHCQVPSSTEDLCKARESPQFLNLCLASLFVSSILEVKSGGLIPAGKEIMSGNFPNSIVNILATVTEHIQDFGPLWVPATFRAYLSFCRNIEAIQVEPSNFANKVDPDKLLRLLHEKVASFWGGLQSTGRIVKHHISGQISMIKSTDYHQIPQREISNIPTSTTFSSQRFSQNETNAQHTSSGEMLNSISNEAMDISSFSRSIANEGGDESLFNSLALLDPVDWSTNQPEFMENLGFASDFDQSDLNSFFNM